VQTQDYLLTCMRYIELNPIRANMVQAPAALGWILFLLQKRN
jgi:putative transposase